MIEIKKQLDFLLELAELVHEKQAHILMTRLRDRIFELQQEIEAFEKAEAKE